MKARPPASLFVLGQALLFVLSCTNVCVAGYQQEHIKQPHSTSEGYVRCGVEDLDTEIIARIEEDKKQWDQEHQKQQQQQHGRNVKTSGDGQTINVPVSFHVIHDGSSGRVSSDVVQNQVQVLNETFVDFGFELRELTYHDNSNWYYSCYFAEDTYKSEIRASLGDVIEPHVLHFYVCTAGWGGYLGLATFPYWAQLEPFQDGIICSTETLPGQEFEDFNQGLTAVHEVGHWLGLYHTFQGGCDEGDMVDDTPAEDFPAYGCAPLSRDTCPDDPGYDPVQNYMDYGDDACVNQFTTGQEERMLFAYQYYRSQNRTAIEPKTNDICLNATEVRVGDEVAGDSFGATYDVASTENADFGVCFGFTTNDSPGLWYKIVGDGRTISLSICNNASNFDAQAAVFQGPCGQLTCLGFSRSSSCTPVEIDTEENQDYFVLVNDGVGLTGNFLLEIESDETLPPLPSESPSLSGRPSSLPSRAPSSGPTTSISPTTSLQPSASPSSSPLPTHLPSSAPSWSPTAGPSCNPSSDPSSLPSVSPTSSSQPSAPPSSFPSAAPTTSSLPTELSVCSGAFVSLSVGTDVRSLSLSDDDTETLNLPFDFPWMSGQVFHQGFVLRVSSNGQINMDGSTNNNCCEADAIGGYGSPRIALSQEDLDPSAGGSVLIKETVNSVVVSFQNVPFYAHSASFVNVQAELLPTGTISICFGDGDSGGNSFATGIEDPIHGFSAAEYLGFFDANGISYTWPIGYCFCWSPVETEPPSVRPSSEPSSSPIADCVYGCGDCGEARTDPGCTCPICASLVCTHDSYCCGNVWDRACAEEAKNRCFCGSGSPTASPTASPLSVPGPPEFQIRVEIFFDNGADEISWSLTNNHQNSSTYHHKNTTVIASGQGTSAQNQQIVSWIVALAVGGPYTFTITDSAGDGLCCGNGSGQYLVRRENVFGVGVGETESGRHVIASGDSFGFQESTSFLVGLDGSTTNVAVEASKPTSFPSSWPSPNPSQRPSSVPSHRPPTGNVSGLNSPASSSSNDSITIPIVVAASVGGLFLGAATMWLVLVWKRCGRDRNLCEESRPGSAYEDSHPLPAEQPRNAEYQAPPPTVAVASPASPPARNNNNINDLPSVFVEETLSWPPPATPTLIHAHNSVQGETQADNGEEAEHPTTLPTATAALPLTAPDRRELLARMDPYSSALTLTPPPPLHQDSQQTHAEQQRRLETMENVALEEALARSLRDQGSPPCAPLQRDKKQ